MSDPLFGDLHELEARWKHRPDPTTPDRFAHVQPEPPRAVLARRTLDALAEALADAFPQHTELLSTFLAIIEAAALETFPLPGLEAGAGRWVEPAEDEEVVEPEALEEEPDEGLDPVAALRLRTEVEQLEDLVEALRATRTVRTA